MGLFISIAVIAAGTYLAAIGRQITGGQYLLIARATMYYSPRIVLWTLALAYAGFLVGSRGTRTFDSRTISEAFIGAILGCLLGVMFTRRARRKHL